ncbi:MAG: hypothetical protein F2832_08780 [Actinobacteria bacterium]|nr:hypothetical protein [Actinomycetota bacterium]
MRWYRSWWVRGPVLALVLVDGGLTALTPEEWVDEAIAVRVISGAAIFFIGGLMVFALVPWAFKRLIKRPSSYPRVLLSFPLMLLVWVGVHGMDLRRAELNPNAPSILQSTTETQRQRQLADDRAAFGSWLTTYSSSVDTRVEALAKLNRWARRDEPFSAQGQERLQEILALARKFRRQTLDLDENPYIADALPLMLRDATTLLAGVRLLVQMPDSPGQAEAKRVRADKLFERSQESGTKAVEMVDKVYIDFGGREAFP